MKIISLKNAFWPNLKMQNYFENNVSEACILMVFETMCTCRENIEINVAYAYIMTVFETIWNCRQLLKTVSLKHAF